MREQGAQVATELGSMGTIVLQSLQFYWFLQTALFAMTTTTLKNSAYSNWYLVCKKLITYQDVAGPRSLEI